MSADKAAKPRIPDYLGHILEAIQRIRRYVEDMDEVPIFVSIRQMGTKLTKGIN